MTRPRVSFATCKTSTEVKRGPSRSYTCTVGPNGTDDRVGGVYGSPDHGHAHCYGDTHGNTYASATILPDDRSESPRGRYGKRGRYLSRRYAARGPPTAQTGLDFQGLVRGLHREGPMYSSHGLEQKRHGKLRPRVCADNTGGPSGGGHRKRGRCLHGWDQGGGATAV